MKKSILTSILFLLSFTISFGQSSKQDKNGAIQVNVYGGKPVGVLNGHADYNVGFSVGYLGYINDIVRVGGSIGYDHTSVKSDSPLKDHSTFEFLTIGGTAELDLISNFYIGADLGYAFKIDPKTYQSHYFTPKIGYRFTDMFNVYAHYKGVRFPGYQVASVGLGLSLDF